MVYTSDIMAAPLKFDAERRAAYLLAYERIGEVAPAAAAVGVHRSTIYGTMAKDPDFKEACDVALARLLDKAHATLRKIAIDGVVTKTYDKEGNLVREETKYDTRALLRFLARHDPAWRDKVEVDQTVTGSMEHTHSVQPKDLSRSARSRVRDLLDELPKDASRN